MNISFQDLLYTTDSFGRKGGFFGLYSLFRFSFSLKFYRGHLITYPMIQTLALGSLSNG